MREFPGLPSPDHSLVSLVGSGRPRFPIHRGGPGPHPESPSSALFPERTGSLHLGALRASSRPTQPAAKQDKRFAIKRWSWGPWAQEQSRLRGQTCMWDPLPICPPQSSEVALPLEPQAGLVTDTRADGPCTPASPDARPCHRPHPPDSQEICLHRASQVLGSGRPSGASMVAAQLPGPAPPGRGAPVRLLGQS